MDEQNSNSKRSKKVSYAQYTPEEKIAIGKKIYDDELTRYEAARKYNISDDSARKFMRLYRDAYQLPAKKGNTHKNTTYEMTSVSESVKTEIVIPYSKEDFLSEVFMSEEKYFEICEKIKEKKNIILQGAPGVGKTFIARRIAYSIMGSKNDSQIAFIQFHQNYSYEDFMMGFKPTEKGFELKNGIFYSFCKKAEKERNRDFFFIIDEINRGNLSKIFGELLMLIEKEYRGTTIQLAYNGESFSVPSNVYIIGMMNTADRSLAMIDYALRRRFSFIEIIPGYDTDGFRKYISSFNSTILNDLIKCIVDLNKEIIADKSLGRGFCIGHSYFCNLEECTIKKLSSIVKYDILPTLEEYWFDNDGKCNRWKNILLGVVNEG